MKSKKVCNRREFVKITAASGFGFTIIPANVLGGSGRVAPSDKINVGIIGCGTEGIREMIHLLPQEDIQITCVCDPNTKSADYIEWSKNERRNEIRQILGSSWLEGIKGVCAGREVGQEIVETYYANQRSVSRFKGCSAYVDFREMLEKEKDLDAVHVLTPDHLHATIAISAMKKGTGVVMHKPIANRVYEARLVDKVARETGVFTHCKGWSGRNLDIVKNWINEGVIGTLQEIHCWTPVPQWPQWQTYPTETPPVPKGLDWDLWLGPISNRPYHPNFTHAVYRGWYDFGGGAIADNGYYSLWPVFSAFDLGTPTRIEASGSYTSVIKDHVSSWQRDKVAFPLSCRIRFEFPAQGNLPPISLFWYDGGQKPPKPEELRTDNKAMKWSGLMFVGDKGKILDNQIIPEKRMLEFSGRNAVSDRQRGGGGDRLWIDALKEGSISPGNFLNAKNIAETICLGAVALQAATLQTDGEIEWDSENFKLTGMPDANKYLYREYRDGWEL